MNAATKTAPATKNAPGVTKRSSSYNVDPARVVRREGWNKRFDFGDIAELAESIKSELLRDPKDGGLLSPIRVKRVDANKDFDFELVDGDRRLTAIELLLSQGVEFPDGVQAKLVDKNQTDRQSRIQMIAANTGKPFLPLEEAGAFQELRDDGMSVAEIAKEVGRSEMHVRKALDLIAADDSVKDAVKSGKVSSNTAKKIAQVAKGDKALQKELVAKAAEAPKGTINRKARANLEAAINERRDANAKAKGKIVKTRALTPEQLQEMATAVAKHFKAVKASSSMHLLGDDAALRLHIAKDDELAAAFAFGLSQAFLAITGTAVDLFI